jgi:ABC-type branched-subunit amino acid transport system permease subunit
MRGWVPQAEQARAAALQVVLIGVLIATMMVLRPRGLFGNFRERPIMSEKAPDGVNRT